MNEKKQGKEGLFQLSNEELRERFVRGRFAEEQYFGNPDIEQWLEAERQADKPGTDGNGHSRWTDYLRIEGLLRIANGTECRTLSENVNPCRLWDSLSGQPELGWERLAPFLNENLQLRAAKFYRTGLNYPFSPIIDFGNGKAYVVKLGHHEDNPDIIFRPICPRDVLDAALVSWKGFGQTWMNLADKSKQLLCTALAEAIARVRTEAEADYDQAVAVSADGLRLVSYVGSVVVFEQRFRRVSVNSLDTRRLSGGRKILRSSEMRRCKAARGKSIQDIMVDEGIVSVFGPSCLVNCENVQLFIEMPNGSKVFVTHRKYCPDSLFE